MIKLGLYGCGNRTKTLLDSLRNDKLYEVAALYDINQTAMQIMHREYGGVVCKSSEKLINCPEVDAFIISLDPFTHPKALRETMKARKPIFIEKPVSFSAAEVLELARIAEKDKIPVHVGFMRRYMPYHVAAREFIRNNPPGNMFSINCNWFHPGETEMINFLKKDPGNFRLKVSQIPFHCCHALDVMLLYGNKVKKVTGKFIKEVKRPYPSPDELIALLEFESGALGCFHYSSMSYTHEISYQIHAENYTLKMNGDLEICRRPVYEAARAGLGKDIAFYDCRESYHKHMAPEIRTYSNCSVTGKIMFDFINTVRDGAPVAATLMDAYEVAKLAEMIESEPAGASV